MIVKVGDKTYGWGADARDLPKNDDAYGAKLLTVTEELLLGEAIVKAGWKPFWKRSVEDRVVFLVKPKVWRQAITAPQMTGQTLQVKELPKEEEVAQPAPVTTPQHESVLSRVSGGRLG